MMKRCSFVLVFLLSAFCVAAQTDLSGAGTSNCYIVSQSGSYCFRTVKGNSSESVGDVVSCKVLWESFSSSSAPECGILVSEPTFRDGYMFFKTAEHFIRGNAVVAATDSAGTILWSWHIWFTDAPTGQLFVNGDIVMDRNLGAISVNPSSHESYGLLYQWGRKDPFPGSCVKDDNVIMSATVKWPDPVKSDEMTGTIAYATAHPDTFISYNPLNYDWQYFQDDTRWDSVKTIYDPCPQGWKVPPGCFAGFKKYFEQPFTGVGIDFKGKYSTSQSVWFPATGYRYYYDATLYSSGLYGSYWFSSTDGVYADYMFFYFSSGVYPVRHSPRANAYSVRCITER